MQPAYYLIIGGVIAIILGVLMLSGVSFFQLPGDIVLKGEHTRVYMPITTMVILSVFLSIVFYIVRKFN